jgi:hypothetical protein
VVTPVTTSKYISFMASEENGNIASQEAEIHTHCFFALLLYNYSKQVSVCKMSLHCLHEV